MEGWFSYNVLLNELELGSSVYVHTHFRTNSTQVYVELENVNDNRPMFVHNGAFPDTINVTLLEELPDPEMVLMLEVCLFTLQSISNKILFFLLTV